MIEKCIGKLTGKKSYVAAIEAEYCLGFPGGTEEKYVTLQSGRTVSGPRFKSATLRIGSRRANYPATHRYL